MKKVEIFLYTIVMVFVILYTLVVLFTNEFNPFMWKETLQLSFITSMAVSPLICVIEILNLDNKNKNHK